MSAEHEMRDDVISDITSLTENIIEYDVPYVDTDNNLKHFTAQIPESKEAKKEKAMSRAKKRAHKFSELAGEPERRETPISVE